MSSAKVAERHTVSSVFNGPFTAIHNYAESSKVQLESLVPSTLPSSFSSHTRNKYPSFPTLSAMFFPLVNLFIHVTPGCPRLPLLPPSQIPPSLPPSLQDRVFYWCFCVLHTQRDFKVLQRCTGAGRRLSSQESSSGRGLRFCSQLPHQEVHSSSCDSCNCGFRPSWESACMWYTNSYAGKHSYTETKE